MRTEAFGFFYTSFQGLVRTFFSVGNRSLLLLVGVNELSLVTGAWLVRSIRPYSITSRLAPCKGGQRSCSAPVCPLREALCFLLQSILLSCPPFPEKVVLKHRDTSVPQLPHPTRDHLGSWVAIFPSSSCSLLCTWGRVTLSPLLKGPSDVTCLALPVAGQTAMNVVSCSWNFRGLSVAEGTWIQYHE